MRRILSKILFVSVMVFMALVLALSAVLICTVKLLRPERITPVVERVAANVLDADVSVARIELAFEPAFPMLMNAPNFRHGAIPFCPWNVFAELSTSGHS